MAILRAGPWASSSESFLNEPSPLDNSAVPVNCSNSSSATWDWSTLFRKGRLDATGDFSVETDAVSGGDEGEFFTYQIRFRYQAVSDFSFSGSSYSITASEPDENPAIVLQFFKGYEYERVYSDTGNGSISGNFDSIVFPASTLSEEYLIQWTAGIFNDDSSNSYDISLL